MKPTLSPYLNFNGNTAEAMKFYQLVLGGELTIQTFGEAGMAKADEEKDRTMHAELKTDSLSFMASDGHPDQEVKFGDNVHMSIVGSDEATLTEYFNKLAEGGKVDMPLAKQFWGDTFGMLTDKFGARKIFAGGLMVFSIVYFLFGIINSSFWIWFLFPLYGIYIAATDGVFIRIYR